MKLIIAGGRDYEKLTDADLAALERLRPEVAEVVSGGARGADHLGERWAVSRNIPVTRFNADTATHGPAAWIERRGRMLACADAVFLLPGDDGTVTWAEADKAGIAIHEP